MIYAVWFLVLCCLALIGRIYDLRHDNRDLRRLLDQFHRDYQARELRRGK